MADEGKGAVVLGGSAGVGRAVVAQLVRDGFRVGVVARGKGRLAALEREHPGAVFTASADVSDDAALQSAVDTLLADVGTPSIWVNCAMLTSFSPFDEMSPDEFRRIGDVTYLGQVNGTRRALTAMRTGAIVNVGSGLAYRSVPFQSAYCGAKAAINGFTSAIRSELIRDKRPISLSLVQLPAINTPQFDWARNRLSMKPQPAPPIYQPEVAARAILRAARDGNRELLVGKSVLQLVFGNFILPAWLDRKLAKSGAEMQKSDRPEPGDRPDNLMSPVEHPASAHGSFDARASDDGLIVDADTARRIVFFGGGAAILVVGLILGLLIG